VSFTDTQKVAIRRYLGFPLGFYSYNPLFEGMLDKIGGVPEEKAAVETVLTELATIDALIAASGASSSSMGSLKKADDVEWYNTTTESNTASVNAPQRGRMLINRLAAVFGLKTSDLPSLYFSSGSSGGGEMALG